MLSIGSVVYLEDGNQQIMITNWGPVIDEDNELVYLDYAGCAYPEGIHADNPVFFNEENIEQIIHEGYRDEEVVRKEQLYRKWCASPENPYKKYRMV